MKFAISLSFLILFTSAVLAQVVPGGTTHGTLSGSASAEVLSDAEGIDFGPYLVKVLQSVRKNWYNLIPEEARPPELKQGKVAIELAVLKDGKVAGLKLVSLSGDMPMDRAAWGGIVASVPFEPLPAEFHGPYLAVRFHFEYNPSKAPEKSKPGQKPGP